MNNLIAIYSNRYTEAGSKKAGSLIRVRKSIKEDNIEKLDKTDKVCYMDEGRNFISRLDATKFSRYEKYKELDNVSVEDKEIRLLTYILELPLQYSKIVDIERLEKTDTFTFEDKSKISFDKETNILKCLGYETIEKNDIEEFKELVKEYKTLSVDDYVNITLKDCNWTNGYSSNDIESIISDNIDDNEDIIAEKKRIKALLEFKLNYDKMKQSVKDNADSNNEVEAFEEDTEDTKDTEENLIETIGIDSNSAIEGDPHCPICHGVGRFTNKIFGLVTVCTCVETYKRKKLVEAVRVNRANSIKMLATAGEQEAAIKDGLIPENRRDDRFNLDVVSDRLKLIGGENRLQVTRANYEGYLKTLYNINTLLGSGTGLKHSYIISAPNGFSKTTFANSCIANLSGSGKAMVPYKPLSEIAKTLLIETANFRFTRARQFDKIIHKKPGEYRWEDYTDAYVVFCFLTIPEFAEVELSTLKALLSIRGNKGLATVIFCERPLSAYNVSQDVELFLLSDMVTANKNIASFDRPLSVELNRTIKTSFKMKSGKDI